MSSEEMLVVKDLKKSFRHGKGKKSKPVPAVDDVSLTIYKGETLGLMGESGCGKTTFGRTVLRLIEPDSGELYFKGENITKANMRPLRRKMQIVFQDPMGSLDPRMRIGDIILEGINAGGTYSRQEQHDRLMELINKVGLSAEIADRYPHELSGGQQQRVGIARALAVQPEFLVCDEAVSALDISYQAQIINLLREIQEKDKLTYLFISHDFSVVRYISDRICIMYLGKVMELGKTSDIVSHPLHPYTHLLMSAILYPDPSQRQIEDDPGEEEVADLSIPEHGCRFQARCPYADDVCRKDMPEFKDYGEGHFCACHKCRDLFG